MGSTYFNLFWPAHFCMTEQNNLEENQNQLTKLIQQGLILQQQGSLEKARIL